MFRTLFLLEKKKTYTNGGGYNLILQVAEMVSPFMNIIEVITVTSYG